jgi:glycerol kinase
MLKLGKRFEPKMSAEERAERLAGWDDAVRRSRSHMS